MTPSKKSQPKTRSPSTVNTSPHAPTDWETRKSQSRLPFDIVIITQTPIESEMDILFDHGGEPAAKYKGDARIYRLRDGRFAIMALDKSALINPPPELEFWNWWGRTTTPSFSDLTTAREIDHLIEQIEFMKENDDAPRPDPPLRS